jgi:anti-sigma B factor antagonist
MPFTRVVSDSTSNPARPDEHAFDCTLGDGGRGAAWVRVGGRLDRATAPQLTEVLTEATRRARIVVLDLRGLTRVDTTGVGAIADASRAARRDGRRLVLVRGLSQVERLLALIGASDAVEIVDLDPAEPPVVALLQLAHSDHAGARQRAGVPRRVAILMGGGQVTRGIDALIARGTRHDFIDG